MFTDLGWQECECLLVLVLNVLNCRSLLHDHMIVSLDPVFSRLISVSSHSLTSLPGRCHYLQKQQVSGFHASGSFDLGVCIGFIWKQNFSSDRHSKGNVGLLQIQPGTLCPKLYCRWDSVVSIESTMWILNK